MRLHYAYASAPGAGLRGKPKKNQDSVLVRTDLAGKSMLLGVCDGHGADGALVSSIVAATLPDAIVAERELLKKGAYMEAMGRAFTSCHSTLMRQKDVDTELSGTTACVMLAATPNKLIIANVGDSRCLMGRLEGRDMVAYEMSNDHVPALPTEAARILAAGGRIGRYVHAGREVGPLRVWLKDSDMPGLSMTRSLGDGLAHSVGVSDIPEVLVYEASPDDQYLILMSDGISEFIPSQEVVAFVHKCAQDGKCPRQAAQELVKEARKRWQLQEDGIIDDCTAVVIYLEHDQVLPTTEHARVDVSLVQHKAGLGGCLPILKQGKLV